MQSNLYIPKNVELRKYIQYFLINYSSDKTYDKVHISYPNTNHCLGLLKGQKLERLRVNEYTFKSLNGFSSYWTGLYESPMHKHMHGEVTEICINFEPGGFELFSKTPLSASIFEGDVIEDCLSPEWKTMYQYLNSVDDPHFLIDQLETFLLRQLYLVKAEPFIPFNEFEANNVDALKSHFHSSYRTIHRTYSKRLGIGPKRFLAMRRFRKAIKTMTEDHFADVLCLYADQSHFIREFKKYTLNTPSTFKNNALWVNGTMIWSLVENDKFSGY